MPSERDVDMAIAALHAVKLAYSTGPSDDQREIVARVCALLKTYGQVGKYLAEGIRQDMLPPSQHRSPEVHTGG